MVYSQADPCPFVCLYEVEEQNTASSFAWAVSQPWILFKPADIEFTVASSFAWAVSQPWILFKPADIEFTVASMRKCFWESTGL